MKPIDIFITTYLRQAFTEKTLSYLFERTEYPYRLFVLNNGGNDEVLEACKDKIFLRIDIKPNAGIHAAWNIASALAESDYFITSDNDIYVPDLRDQGKCWLTQLVGLMDRHIDYGAISLHPHIFIGIAGEDPKDPEDVKPAPMCGAVMRIMRTDLVRRVGGWDHVVRTSRNHEERTICSRIQTSGYKVGRTTRIRAYHPFGINWGYPVQITPEMQGHNPQLKDYVRQFDNMDAYDTKTWLPKV